MNHSNNTISDNESFLVLSSISNFTDGENLDNVTQSWITIILISVFVPTSFVFGIVGNTLVIFVFGKELKRGKKASNLLIVLMGVVDLVTCSVVVLAGLVTLVLDSAYPPAFLLATELIITCGLYSAMFLCQMMAVDRYIAVCRPHSSLYTRRKIAKVAVLCFLASMVLSFCSLVKPIEYYFNLIQLGFVAYMITGVVMSTLYYKLWRELYSNKIHILDSSAQRQTDPSPGGVPNLAWTNHRHTESSPRSSQNSNQPQTSESRHLQSNHGDNPPVTHPQNNSTHGHISSVATIQRGDRLTGYPVHAEGSVISQRRRRQQTLVRRLVTTFFVITILFMLSWIPVWLYYFGIVSQRARMVIFINNFLNPIVYFLSNTKFRLATLNYFNCSFCKRRYS